MALDFHDKAFFMNKIKEIIALLEKAYPDARLILNYANPFQLLVSAILAAQCTDERVNQVTSTLFKKYKMPVDFANAVPEDLEKEIKSTGFYRNKAKHIIHASIKIVNSFDGIVPSDINRLMELEGVARKTANMIMSNAFGLPCGIAVDTHVKRVTYRLDFTKHTDPDKIEQDLLKKVPIDKWKQFPLIIAMHGRTVCQARKPRCNQCPVENLCYSEDKPETAHK